MISTKNVFDEQQDDDVASTTSSRSSRRVIDAIFAPGNRVSDATLLAQRDRRTRLDARWRARREALPRSRSRSPSARSVLSGGRGDPGVAGPPRSPRSPPVPSNKYRSQSAPRPRVSVQEETIVEELTSEQESKSSVGAKLAGAPPRSRSVPPRGGLSRVSASEDDRGREEPDPPRLSTTTTTSFDIVPGISPGPAELPLSVLEFRPYGGVDDPPPRAGRVELLQQKSRRRGDATAGVSGKIGEIDPSHTQVFSRPEARAASVDRMRYHRKQKERNRPQLVPRLDLSRVERAPKRFLY